MEELVVALALVDLLWEFYGKDAHPLWQLLDEALWSLACNIEVTQITKHCKNERAETCVVA